MWGAGNATAQQKEILIGSQCDRTGPTQIVGTVFCPAVQDYVNLVNSKGGDRRLQDRHQRARQQLSGAVGDRGGDERQKQEGAVSAWIWGTPQAQA